MWIYWLLCLIVLACLLYLLRMFLLRPNHKTGREGIAAYTKHRYAHRGLHDNKTKAENSLSAFEAAVKAGFAIELDVRLSRDGELVVCHDADLARVAGDPRLVKDLTAEELKKVDLCHTGEGVPTFREVLDLVGGRVPILVEIKEDAGEKGVAAPTCEMLAGYKGEYVIESFNPLSLSVVKKMLPEVFRGYLCAHLSKEEKYRSLLYRALEHFLLNFICRPDFIAYDFTDRDYPPFRNLISLFKPITFAWTVRSAEDEKICRDAGFDTVIFENYIPTEN